MIFILMYWDRIPFYSFQRLINPMFRKKRPAFSNELIHLRENILSDELLSSFSQYLEMKDILLHYI